LIPECSLRGRSAASSTASPRANSVAYTVITTVLESPDRPQPGTMRASVGLRPSGSSALPGPSALRRISTTGSAISNALARNDAQEACFIHGALTRPVEVKTSLSLNGASIS
jgi:hypothetical protein